MRSDDMYPYNTKFNENKMITIINLIFDIHDFCTVFKNI